MVVESEVLNDFPRFVGEGLDLYVHKKRRGSALAIGFADESLNRLLRRKLEGPWITSTMLQIEILHGCCWNHQDIIEEFTSLSLVGKILGKETSSKISHVVIDPAGKTFNPII
ncbi:hypothetical protein Tco_0637153 [Tanacetum coccineum]